MSSDKAQYQWEVRTRVKHELSKRGWTDKRFAAESGINVDTVSDFLSGKTWPRRGTQTKIAETLGDLRLFDEQSPALPDTFNVLLGPNEISYSDEVKDMVSDAFVDLIGPGNMALLNEHEIDELRLAARTATLKMAQEIFARPEVMARRYPAR